MVSNGQRACPRDEGGFTLLELMVTMTVVMILLAVAVPTFLGTRSRAQERAAQTTASTALKAERAYYLSYRQQQYTGDGAELEDIEPAIDYDAVMNDSCVAFTGANCVQVSLISPVEVLLVTQSASGTYWAIREVASGPGSGTYYNQGGDTAPPPAATVVDERW